MISTLNTTTTTTTTTTPLLVKDNGYCYEHYECTEENKYSFTGCVQYYDNGDPGCHLFCEIQRCGATYNPHSGYCTFYHCAPRTTTTATTTTTGTTTTTVATTTAPVFPVHDINPFFWCTVVLSLFVLGAFIFWLGRKVGVRSRFSRVPQNASPSEATPLTQFPTSLANEAWAVQNLEAQAATAAAAIDQDEDEFSYFEYKLMRPRQFRFPTIESAKEKFSGLDHSILADEDLPPFKRSLCSNSPDEYKASIDIVSLQKQLKQDEQHVRELRRALAFLKEEQADASSYNATRIARGKVILPRFKIFAGDIFTKIPVHQNFKSLKS